AVVLGAGGAGGAGAPGERGAEVPFAGVRGSHRPAAIGHPGLIRSYAVGDLRVLCFLGRTHVYEGHGLHAVAHAVRTAASCGCRVAVLTNANGALRPDWPPGTGVVIRDHINLAGVSPLVGPRFVDLTDCWSPRLRRFAVT